MKLNHLNLTVNDVDMTRAFLENYFHMKCVSPSRKGFAVMYDDDQFVLTLMQGKDVQYPKTFHIGFPQESREDVDYINQRLQEDGYQVSSPIESHGYTFYVKSPGGFTVEVIKRKGI